jgi:hypothetical protein
LPSIGEMEYHNCYYVNICGCFSIDQPIPRDEAVPIA